MQNFIHNSAFGGLSAEQRTAFYEGQPLAGLGLSWPWGDSRYHINLSMEIPTLAYALQVCRAAQPMHGLHCLCAPARHCCCHALISLACKRQEGQLMPEMHRVCASAVQSQPHNGS